MIDQSPAHPFTWVPAPWGRALHSPVIARVASHLFTTRDLTLRGSGAEGGWAQLAEAVGVSPHRLVRLEQVHGVEVVVIRAGESRRREAGMAGASARVISSDSDTGRPRADIDPPITPIAQVGGDGGRMSDAAWPRADIDPPITPITQVGGDGGRMSDAAWPRADIVMTDDPAIAVAVQVADCVPLLLADPVTRSVAAVHGGWRGTAAVVGRVAVAAMTAHFGARPADLLAAIGPSIGACCYQVGPDVLDAFRAAGFPEENLRDWFRPDDVDKNANVAPGFSPVNARYRLDVPRAIIDQLSAAGLAPANIAACGLCTACHPSLFPSYRRDGAGTGRLAGVIRPRCDGRSRWNEAGAECR